MVVGNIGHADILQYPVDPLVKLLRICNAGAYLILSNQKYIGTVTIAINGVDLFGSIPGDATTIRRTTEQLRPLFRGAALDTCEAIERPRPPAVSFASRAYPSPKPDLGSRLLKKTAIIVV